MSPRLYVGACQVPRPASGCACSEYRIAKSQRVLHARHLYKAKLVSPFYEPGNLKLRPLFRERKGGSLCVPFLSAPLWRWA